MSMRRNTISSTAGFKMDLKIEFPVSRNIYIYAEIRPSNDILRPLSPFFVILSLFMHRNITNSTSGFKTDLKFRLLVPKNMYTRGN